MHVELKVGDEGISVAPECPIADTVHDLAAVVAIALQNSGYQVVIRSVASCVQK